MANGYEYLSQASGAVKGMRNTGGGGPHIDPKYVFNMGSLQAMHIINEDYETHSKHNLNIDEFNVHTRDLGYFETQTITFLADKKGSFEYYCTIHPDMRGTIEIVWETASFKPVKAVQQIVIVESTDKKPFFFKFESDAYYHLQIIDLQMHFT